jgi:hypothetical protein
MDQLKMMIISQITQYKGPIENLQKICEFLDSPDQKTISLVIRGPNSKHERIANGGLITVEMKNEIRHMRVIPQSEKPYIVNGFQDAKFIGVHKNTDTNKVYFTRLTLNERQFKNVPGTCNMQQLWQKSRHVYRQNDQGIWIKQKEVSPMYIRCGAKNCKKVHNLGQFVPDKFTMCEYCEDVNISYSISDDEELPIVEELSIIDPFKRLSEYISDTEEDEEELQNIDPLRRLSEYPSDTEEYEEHVNPIRHIESDISSEKSEISDSDDDLPEVLSLDTVISSSDDDNDNDDDNDDDDDDDDDDDNNTSPFTNPIESQREDDVEVLSDSDDDDDEEGTWEVYDQGIPFNGDTEKLLKSKKYRESDIKIPSWGGNLDDVKRKCLALKSIAFVTKLNPITGERDNIAYIRDPKRTYEDYIKQLRKNRSDSKGYKIYIYKKH